MEYFPIILLPYLTYGMFLNKSSHNLRKILYYGNVSVTISYCGNIWNNHGHNAVIWEYFNLIKNK